MSSKERIRVQIDLNTDDADKLRASAERCDASTLDIVEHASEVYRWLHEHKDEEMEYTVDGQVYRVPIRFLL